MSNGNINRVYRNYSKIWVETGILLHIKVIKRPILILKNFTVLVLLLSLFDYINFILK